MTTQPTPRNAAARAYWLRRGYTDRTAPSRRLALALDCAFWLLAALIAAALIAALGAAAALD